MRERAETLTTTALGGSELFLLGCFNEFFKCCVPMALQARGCCCQQGPEAEASRQQAGKLVAPRRPAAGRYRRLHEDDRAERQKRLRRGAPHRWVRSANHTGADIPVL